MRYATSCEKMPIYIIPVSYICEKRRLCMENTSLTKTDPTDLLTISGIGCLRQSLNPIKIYIYIHIYIYIYIHTHTYIHLGISVRIYIHMYMCIDVYIYFNM